MSFQITRDCGHNHSSTVQLVNFPHRNATAKGRARTRETDEDRERERERGEGETESRLRWRCSADDLRTQLVYLLKLKSQTVHFALLLIRSNVAKLVSRRRYLETNVNIPPIYHRIILKLLI